MNKAISLRQETKGAGRRELLAPRAMNWANCSGNPARKSIHGPCRRRRTARRYSCSGGCRLLRCRIRRPRRRGRTGHHRPSHPPPPWPHRLAAGLCSRTRRRLHLAFLHNRQRGPGMKHQMRLLLSTSSCEQLEPFRIHRRRPGDDAVESAVRCAQCEADADLASPNPRAAGPRRLRAAGDREFSAKPRITGLPSQSVIRSIQITRPPVERPPR